MSKGYDYHFSDAEHSTTGTMICAGCGTKIYNGIYLHYKKDKDGDWGFVNYHLSCALKIDNFILKYADFLKKGMESKLKRDQEIAKRKREAIKIIQNAIDVEIGISENFDGIVLLADAED